MEPNDFAKWLATSLRESGRSQSDLARHLGVDPSIINKIVNRRRKVKLAEALRIRKFFNAPTSDLAELTPARSTLVTAYLAGVVEAGAFREVAPFDDQEFDEDRYVATMVDPKFPNARLLAFDVAGDSMNKLEPRPILPGDRIIAVAYEDIAAQAPLREDMVVVVERSRDGGLTREWSVKQVEVHADTVEFHPRSSSPRHKPIVVNRDLDADDGVTVEVIAVVRQVLNQIPLG